MTSAISTAPFGGPEVPRSVVTEHSKQCRFKWNWWRTSHNFIIVWFQSDDQCAANDCNANILLWLISFHVNAITSQNSCRTNTLLEPRNSGFLYGVHILTQWRSRRFNTNKFPAMCVGLSLNYEIYSFYTAPLVYKVPWRITLSRKRTPGERLLFSISALDSVDEKSTGTQTL